MTIKERFKVIIVPHLILLKEDKVLLYLRQNTDYANGMYSLVAGHLDGGESVSQAMIREAQEEAGIEIAPQDLFLGCTVHLGFKEGKEYIYFYFICRQWKNEPQNMEPQKCAELKFYSLNGLPTNLLLDVKKGIECALNGIHYYEYPHASGKFSPLN